MLYILIILVVLLAIAVYLAVRYRRELRLWTEFDEEATVTLANSLTKMRRLNQLVLSLLERNYTLRLQRDEAESRYDDLMIKYAMVSLSATVVDVEEDEILKVEKSAPHWIDGLGYVTWVEGKGHVPLDPQPDFVNDLDLEVEIPVDYYIVDQDQS